MDDSWNVVSGTSVVNKIVVASPAGSVKLGTAAG